jgi:hypothetical protein
MNSSNENPSDSGYPASTDGGGEVGYAGIDVSYSSFGEQQGGEDGGEYYYTEYPTQQQQQQQQQQQAMYNPYQQQQFDEFGSTSPGNPGTWDEPSTAKKGDYFCSSEFSPEIYDHAISALAYDPNYECMYLASTTQNMSSTRHNKAKNHRASLLLTYSNATPAKEYFFPQCV